MAVLKSLLRITAGVDGQGQVAGLAGALGGVKKAGDAASKSLGGLAQAASMQGLGGAFARLMPLLSVGGIAAMTKSAIDAGDAFWDMSQRTGVSVEMLARFKRAAALSGTSIEAVEKGLLRLSRNMAAAAAAPRVGEMTKADMDRAVAAVRDGERRQVSAVEAAADDRMQSLQDESSRRLAEINRRYRDEQRILDDSFDDQRDAAEKASQDQADAQVRGIQRSFDARRRAIQRDERLGDEAREQALTALQDAEDRQVSAVRDAAAERTKALSRALRDQQQAQQDAMDDRRRREETAIKAAEKLEGDSLKASTKAQLEAIKTAADAKEAMVKGTNTDALSQQLEELGLSSKEAAKLFAELGIRVTDSNGKMRNSSDVMLDVGDALKRIEDPAKRADVAMRLMGRGGAELIPMLLMGSESIRALAVSMTTEFAKAADEYSDKLIGMSGKVGRLGIDLAVALLPALISVTEAITATVTAFNNMPGPLKAVTLAIVGAALVLPGLIALLANLVIVGNAIAGLKIGATIAGWLGVAGPAIAGIQTLLSGLVAWITTVAVPAIAAFLASPLGLALIVVAVVGLLILFRKEIGAFFLWLIAGIGNALGAVAETIRFVLGETWRTVVGGMQSATAATINAIRAGWLAFAGWFGKTIITPITSLWNGFTGAVRNGMKSAADFVIGIWNNITRTVTNAVNAVVNAIRSLLRPVINAVNSTITGFNRLSAKVGGAQLGTIPAFAEGGVVTKPTLALVGEGGEREYIVPESKAAAFSTNYLEGRRGAATLQIGNPQINISTGPVMQAQDGQRYATLADLERVARASAEGALATLRSPQARRALGMA